MCQLTLDLPHCQIQSIEQTSGRICVHAHSLTQSEPCPDCGHISDRVHSYYTRHLGDLPLPEAALEIRLRVKRFRCQQVHCKRQTFVELLPSLTQPYSRHTKRLSRVVWHLGQALGGQAGARLASQLAIPTSRHHVLRLLRAQVRSPLEPIRALGVDDWAKKRGQSYGTILVDLDRHQVVDLLPDREAGTLAEWLATHPQLEIVTRDRSTEYARGITAAVPNAIQVADRWHLLRNLKEMLDRALREHWTTLKSRHTSVAEPASAKQLRFPRSRADQERQQLVREKRIQSYTRVQFLKQKGLSQRRIARTLNVSRATVRQFYHAAQYPE